MHLEQQLNSNVMLDVTLKLISNFQLLTAFRIDLGLRPKLKLAREYNQLLRDFAINQLLSATDLDMI